jgi:pimeloyl-ACP methyl ester carboxylesterase
MLLGTNNNSLNFIATGKGHTTLVFLHYFGGSSESWSGVITALKNSFRCIAIDLRGFGNSPVPDEQLSVNDNANDVIDLIHALQLEEYVLIAHSMGGKIALDVASQRLAGLTSLILIAPSPPTPEPSSHEERINLIVGFRDRSAIEKLIMKITALPLPEYLFEETVQTHFKTSHVAWNGWIEKGSREDISSLMQNINVPVSIISGASDPNFSTLFLKTEFVKYFSTACFKEIEGGHLLPVEVPSEVAKFIEEFVTK